jgi:predicted nucleotidyltransferase
MPSVQEILKKIREQMPALQERYKVSRLELFGSFVRGEQKGKSDIDILVEFSETIDLFMFIELENFLSEKLGAKVDLVMKDTLKPRIKDAILSEAIPV